jgi:enoyl-CoA hydratase/carnithine racemase
MQYQTLNYQKINQVAMVSIISPVDNPFTLVQLSEELTELCDRINWDEEVRVVILLGTGEMFFPLEKEPMPYSSIAEPITKLDKPIIIAMDGNVIGQGLELALACDIRIAAEKSCFGFPQIKAGLIPWDGGTQRLTRLVGKGKALEMILTGESIDVQEAHRIGLISKIVPSGQLMTTVSEMAQEMASKAPIALRYTKEAISKGMEMTLEQGLLLEADLYLLLHTTKDRTEGIQAFREKKIPKFEGR